VLLGAGRPATNLPRFLPSGRAGADRDQRQLVRDQEKPRGNRSSAGRVLVEDDARTVGVAIEGFREERAIVRWAKSSSCSPASISSGEVEVEMPDGPLGSCRASSSAATAGTRRRDPARREGLAVARPIFRQSAIPTVSVALFADSPAAAAERAEAALARCLTGMRRATVRGVGLDHLH
jgi:hypothetical protein